MSTVYRALLHADRLEPVAIKQVSVRSRSAEDRAEARRWLAREAGLLSSLDHPQLPKLVAAFSEGDEHFVVMPFLDGTTLKEQVKQSGPLQVGEAIHWARALTELLVYLHGHDPPILHRDLKPDNVLITLDRRLVVLDLGTARPLVRGLPGTAIGTPGYAAPEQYQGLADERSDLYALGATLHYLLTGYDAEQEAPFRHPPVRQRNPQVDPGTEAMVAQLVSVVPDERPTSAAAVQDTLEQLARVHLCAGILAYYTRQVRRSITRDIPMSLLALTGAALADMHVFGFLDWLQPWPGSWLQAFVASLCVGTIAQVLAAPSAVAAASRNGNAPGKPALPPSTYLIIGGVLFPFYMTLAHAVQWLILPVLLATTVAVTWTRYVVTSRRLRQARESLETALSVPNMDTERQLGD